ncbi:MAG: KpsF/GutQ family sugar-phosphate isomerase [Magnetococcales bacterium]|nr:KpsF/GutQ family sugar-phosphate isomerase [Magnetococcales bacterium]NGZ26786.1 KpsF/GutQ family sugar-phosphate isomerase [Magnetococcales bacterium]
MALSKESLPFSALESARRTLAMEADSLQQMAARLDEQFEKATDLLFNCHGRVVITGMGKSGLIARKIAATLASTGTPAFFLHPAEGSHGDIGMVTPKDVVVALSNSGETQEVVALLPVIKRMGIGLLSLVGNVTSTLARMSDVVLDVSVSREACPMNLAPTSSTTAALAMGDALAVALLEKRNFDPDDFALLHPGGSLGKKLLLRVGDLMLKQSEIPLVARSASFHETILEMTAKRMGMTGVCDENGQLIGIITDGDLRRLLEKDQELTRRQASEIMTLHPRTIRQDALAMEALHRMETHKITSLFVVDENQALTGVLHLHHLLAAGLV